MKTIRNLLLALSLAGTCHAQGLQREGATLTDQQKADTRTGLGLGTAATADLSNVLFARSYALLPTNTATHFYSRIYYKAVEYGMGANDITVAHVISGGGSTASVGVAGRAITVTAGSTCTAETLVAAVNASTPAAALVTASMVGTQSGSLLTAVSATALRSSIKHDANGSLIMGQPNGTGTEETNVTLYDGPGNIVIQDMGVFGALKPNATDATIKDGSGWIFRMRPWTSHGGSVGARIPETTWDIDGSLAIIPSARTQYGNNSSQRDAAYFQFVSGEPTATIDEIRRSRGIMMQVATKNGGAATVKKSIAWQAVPADNLNTSRVLKFWDEATVDENTAGYTTGDFSGTAISEMGVQGTWNPGIASDFTTITASSNIFTQTCSKYRTSQNAKFTLGATNTLAISGAVAGMRGVIYVTQDSAGSRTLTLPSESSTTATWVLSTTAGTTDRLMWEYDGNYYFFSMTKGFELPLDSDASTFITRQGTTDATEKAAINTLVRSLKTASLWTKFYAIYPFIGADGTAQSKNLISDTYNITWSGTGHTFASASGVTGAVGTSAYGNTGINFSTLSVTNNSSGYVYVRSAAPTEAGYWFGVTDANGRFGFKTSSTYPYVEGPHNSSGGMLGNLANFKGQFASSRSSSTAYLSRSAGATYSSTSASVGAPNQPIFILARNNNGSPSGYSNVNLGMAAFGNSLTSGEWETFEGIVTAYQTTLGRQN